MSRSRHGITGHGGGCLCPGCAEPDDPRYWKERAEKAEEELEALRGIVDTPATRIFLEAIPLEAAHQIRRFGVDHDAGKEPEDWFWVLGWLAGKAVHAARSNDVEKAKHHTISSAAVLLNWHRRLSGEDQSFRPGIDPPDSSGEE